MVTSLYLLCDLVSLKSAEVFGFPTLIKPAVLFVRDS
jgi:hypothetical protein